jgi:hypothetical protein
MKQFLEHLNFLIGKKGVDQIRSFEVKKVYHGEVINMALYVFEEVGKWLSPARKRSIQF